MNIESKKKLNFELFTFLPEIGLSKNLVIWYGLFNWRHEKATHLNNKLKRSVQLSDSKVSP